MANTKNNNWGIEDWLLIFGGIWLLLKVFKTPKAAGIGALPDSQRFFYSIHNTKKTDLIVSDMSNYSRDEVGEIIRLIISARVKPELSPPIFTPFPGSKYIDGELRDLINGWRILCKRLSEGNYLMLSVFKKQTGKTPQHEKDRAEKRCKEWETHRTLVRKPRPNG